MSGKTAKANRRLNLTGITLTFEDGEQVNLNIHKVLIVDVDTKEPLFKPLVESKRSK